jgi:hypothetical protein
METERREKGSHRRREGEKETEEKNKGEETAGNRKKGRDKEERQKTKIQWGEKEERKEEIYRGETMDSGRAEK